MLFEVVFMETAGYIIVGAICERITFGAFLPRFPNGQCNTNGSPVTPRGAFVKFFAVINPLVLRGFQPPPPGPPGPQK